VGHKEWARALAAVVKPPQTCRPNCAESSQRCACARQFVPLTEDKLVILDQRAKSQPQTKQTTKPRAKPKRFTAETQSSQKLSFQFYAPSVIKCSDDGSLPGAHHWSFVRFRRLGIPRSTSHQRLPKMKPPAASTI
jgi:hypothetical protein